MIKFTRVEIQNFLSYQQKQVLDFRSSSAHLIQGENYDEPPAQDGTIESNGAAKSGLPLAVFFALWGSVVRSKKVSVGKIINKKAKKNLMVALELSKDEERYRIERYRKHEDYKDGLRLLKWKGGHFEDISQTDKTMTQDIINSIVVISPTTFLKAILFSREDMKAFLDLPISERASIFENIIQINKLKTYYEKSKKIVSKYEKLISNNEVMRLALTEERQAYRKGFTSEVRRVRSTKKELREQIDFVMSEMESLTGVSGVSYEDVKSFLDLQDKVTSLKKTVKTMEYGIVSSKNILAKHQKGYNSIQRDITATKSSMEKLSPESCPHCGEALDPAAHEKHKAEQEAKLIRLEEQLEYAEDQLVRSAEQVKTSREELATIDKEVEEVTEALDLHHLPEEVRKIAMTGGADIAKQIKDLQELLRNREVELGSVDTSSIARYLENVRGARKQLQDLAEQRVTIDDGMAKAKFWRDFLDFKNENSIKQHIISKIIPVFNEILQRNVNHIFKDMDISFDNYFKETVVYNGEPYDIEEMSFGERSKLNFCISLAVLELTRVNQSGTNLLFLDEIFVSISENSIIKFLRLIKERYTKNAAVYVISHNQTVIDHLEPVSNIVITKREGASSIETT